MKHFYLQLTRFFSICAALLFISVSVNAQSTTPVFMQSFSGTTFPTGWTTFSSNKTYAWSVVSNTNYTGTTGSAMRMYNNTTKFITGLNQWAYTPKIRLYPCITYSVTFHERNIGSGSVAFKLLLSTGATPDYKTGTVITAKTLAANTAWKQHTYSFNVAQEGDYYLDFGVTDLFGAVNLNIDEIKIMETAYLAAEFYNKTGADITLLSSWGTNKDGSGTQPTSFTNTRQHFHIYNYTSGGTVTYSKDWDVTALETKVTLGNNINPVSLLLNNNKRITGTMDVVNYATLTVDVDKCPALGKLSPLSTVVLGPNSPADLIEGTEYGSLVIDSGKKNNLGKKITIKGNLDLKNGKLDLGANDLNLDYGAAAINGSDSKYVVVSGQGRLRQGIRAGAAEAILPVGNLTYNPVKIKLAAGSQDDMFGVGILDGLYNKYDYDVPQLTTAQKDQAVNKTWLVSEDVKGGSNITLTLSWTAASTMQGFDPSYCHIKHYENGAWDYADFFPAVLSGTTYSMTRSGITSFSPFSVSSREESITALPVSLLHFEAKLANNHAIRLNWSTAQEKNNAYFAVERSNDGVNFKAIAQVKGAGTTNTRQDYSFTDNHPLAGTAYYRLRQVDENGTFELLPMRSATLTTLNNLEVMLYPNPVKGQAVTLVVMGVAKDETAHLLITDMMGRSVLQQQLPQELTTAINTNKLQPGTYLVSVTGKNATKIQRLIIK